VKELFPFYSIGHFINQPKSNTAFEITRFGEMDEPEVEDQHKHTFYEIIWTEKGTSKQVIDYQEYTVTPNTLFFISPGQLHNFEAWRKVEGGSIMFTEDFFLLNQQGNDRLFEFIFLDNFYANPCLKPDAKNYKEIKHTIDLIYQEHQRGNRSDAIEQSLLHILLSQIQRSIDSNTKNPVSKKYVVLYKKLKSMVDKHFSEALTVSDYADRLFVTQHHLNHVVKIVTGKTASEVVRERSILEAKRLLTFRDHTITEIAAALGYFDSSYFAKLFKSETGQSPQDFRNSMSEKYRRR
jgi:AraC family transcriptional regulator, transcriptional activator of pobA